MEEWYYRSVLLFFPYWLAAVCWRDSARAVIVIVGNKERMLPLLTQWCVSAPMMERQKKKEADRSSRRTVEIVEERGIESMSVEQK